MKSVTPLSRCISGSGFSEPLRRRSAEKPSCSISSIPPALPECSNCKQERKIREEYDKFIIQVKRDRDSLSQRVTELERELKNQSGEQRENGSMAKDKHGAERDIGRKETATECDEAENEKMTEGEVRQIIEERHEREIREDKIEKERNGNRRQHIETEQKEVEREKGEGEKEDDSTEKESIYTSHGGTEVPKNTEESLLSELHSIRKEYEELKKSAALSMTQLHKEKAELLSHIDDAKTCFEKVCLENAELKARLEPLLKDSSSRPCSGCNGNTDTRDLHKHTKPQDSHMDAHASHTHTVTTNTEMLVVSHSVCQQCTSDLPQDKGNKCCFSSCSESSELSEPTTHTCRCEPTMHKPNLYKQLRREHSLLLDMMLVLYKREWFLQDAMPYVRRTLQKCGLTLEDSD